MALLNPRVWIAIAIVAALAFSHFTAYRSGKNHVRLEWKAAVADANTESRRLEQQRQRRADEASQLATGRLTALRRDAAGAGDSAVRLRDAIAARRLANESQAAAVKRADTAEQLLIESADAYRELAEKADRHASDVRLLLDAWPK